MGKITKYSVYNYYCSTGYLYITVFDLQFYIRLLWYISLSAIMNLAPEERQKGTGAK